MPPRSLLAILVFLAVPPAPAPVLVPVILAVVPPGPVRPVVPARVPVAAVLLLPRRPAQRILDFLLLLLDQEGLHGVVVVVVLLQQHEVPLLLQHRPMPTPRGRLIVAPLAHICVVIPTAALAALGELLPPLQRLPVDAALVHVLVVPRLVPRVVDADHAAVDGRAAQVVHDEVGAALVLVLEPAEAARLARLLVAGELEEGRLSELGEDGDDVALAELVGEPAEVDEGRVAVVDMPGGVGGAVCRSDVLACAVGGGLCSIFLSFWGWYAHSLLDLLLVELLDRSYLVHGGWRRGCAPSCTRVEEVWSVREAGRILGDVCKAEGPEVVPVLSARIPFR